MDKKMPKKISLKDFGMEKIILIAIAGIVLLAANFSEWKNSSSKTSEKQEKSIETSQNDAYKASLVEGCIELDHGNEKLLMNAGDMAVFDSEGRVGTVAFFI